VATLWKLRLPWALPYVFTGLRIAAGLAVIGAIVGEFVGGGGLGVVVLGAMRQQRTDLVFAAVAYASLLGLALFGVVGSASRMALRHWHASEGNR
jgi:NitT/TauT family transport system permease protein